MATFGTKNVHSAAQWQCPIFLGHLVLLKREDDRLSDGRKKLTKNLSWRPEISHRDGLRSSVVKRTRLGRISMRHQLQQDDGHFSMPIVSENV